MRVLLIEDDPVVTDYIVSSLNQQSHTIDHTANGADGLHLASTERYDCMIVDLMLPEMDGLDIIRTLRTSGNTTPILILSALSDVRERVRGLEAGADDYLVKPFAFSELHARMMVLDRRTTGGYIKHETTLRVADLTLDLLTREARRGNSRISLKPREFLLLEYIMKHAGQIVTRTMLLENVWNYYFDPRTNIIDVHISRLRQKIDKDFEIPLIHTVRGSGYVIHTPE